MNYKDYPLECPNHGYAEYQGYIFMPYVMMEESPEMKAERIREERKKKIERIFKDDLS